MRSFLQFWGVDTFVDSQNFIAVIGDFIGVQSMTVVQILLLRFTCYMSESLSYKDSGIFCTLYPQASI